MTTQPHLIAIAIGPVQDFIAASRKTRDLWFGSMLLSQVAGKAAEALRASDAELIFPYLPADAAPNPDDPFPNKLLATLPAGHSPAAVAETVKIAARQEIARYVDLVHGVLKSKTPPACPLVNWELVKAQVGYFAKAKGDQVIEEQIGQFLEFYTAWVPYASATYPQDRERVERLLAGRKALREFQRPPDVWDFYTRPPDRNNKDKKAVLGTAKSSLDPSRETVFQKNDVPVSADNPLRDERDRRALNIKGGEQLDGISLIKRHGDPRRFVSISRVAIDPFIRRLNDKRTDDLGTLRDLAGDLRKSNAVEWFDNGPTSGLQHYQAFAYDCQLFYDPAQRDAELTKREKELALKFYEHVEQVRRSLEIGELPVHVAILAADGDHMGKAISQRTSDTEHKELSQLLSAFATEARTIVKDHHGALIYSGGDDVLAFLPLDTALCCADRLRRRFAAIVNEGKPDGVSLSVGLAVGHYSEHLQNLLKWARTAERAAKDHGRNALAVAMHTRTAGASGTTVVHCWKDDPVNTRWLEWIDWHRREAIPDRAAYELRDLARNDLRAMDGDALTNRQFKKEGESWSLLDLEVKRILECKEPRGSRRLDDGQIKHLLACMGDCLNGLERLVDELIIARHFAEAVTVARGAWTEGEVRCP